MGRREALRGERYRLIDTLRGLALVNMVAFHLCYDIFMIYGQDPEWAFRPATVAWERYICVSFILISGISLNFSKHAYRRGLIVSACGLIITLVTAIAMPEEIILFGVLTCIGACMLITQAVRRLLEKCDPFAGAAAFLALFAFTYGVPRGYLGFFNAELIALPKQLYFFRPLALFEKLGWERAFLRGVPVLDWFGRYSLWIYMIHQPLLMGVCFLIFGWI